MIYQSGLGAFAPVRVLFWPDMESSQDFSGNRVAWCNITKLLIEATIGASCSLRIVSPDLPRPRNHKKPLGFLRKSSEIARNSSCSDWVQHPGIPSPRGWGWCQAGEVSILLAKRCNTKRKYQNLTEFACFLNFNHLGFTPQSPYGCFIVGWMSKKKTRLDFFVFRNKHWWVFSIFSDIRYLFSWWNQSFYC